MNDAHITGLDLNLLKVFEALFEERSATRAAQRLGLTQSAVSHALNRLRYALGDALFQRAPGGLRPTGRAVEIAPQVIGALRQLLAALAPTAFDPPTARRRFVVDATAYIGAVLLPEVVRRVRLEAPMATLAVRNAGPAVVESLDAGRADLAVGGFLAAPERFERLELYEDRFAWALRRPLDARGTDRDQVLRSPKILISVGDAGAAGDELGRPNRWEDEGLPTGGRAGDGPALTVADAQTALNLVARSDMTAFVPRRLALAFRGPDGRAPALVEAFAPAPPVRIALLWRRDRDDPGLAWLRGVLARAAAALQDPP